MYKPEKGSGSFLRTVMSFSLGAFTGTVLMHLYRQGFQSLSFADVRDIFLLWIGLTAGITLAMFLFRKP